MSSLRSIEKFKLEKLFGMESGYVSDFSNRKFREFVITCTEKDIYDKIYGFNDASKANRLRAFWNIEGDFIVAKLTSEMLEYWKEQGRLNGKIINPQEQSLFDECMGIVARLSGSPLIKPITEDEFIKKEFKDLSLKKLNLSSGVIDVLKQRLGEIRKCLAAKSPLAIIFLCGSVLEGVLLGIALARPKTFNESMASPKNKEGKVLQFQEWSLANLIDVSHSLELLGDDVRKFSHVLRDFRNYIHPYQQVASRFSPDEHTAKICWQVLQAAISQLSKDRGVT